MLGILGGTVFFRNDVFSNIQKFPEHTKYGTVYLKKCEKFVFIPRHTMNNNIPPHKINHQANILALYNEGVTEVIGVYSAGSLKKTIKPGTIMLPDDYINLFNPKSFFETDKGHIVPGMSEQMKKKVEKAALKLGIKVKNKGIYLQTIGPRLETKAEVKMLKAHADIVGMTMASEATLCKELGMEFTAICSIDNFANGITSQALSQELIESTSAKSSKLIFAILAEIIG